MHTTALSTSAASLPCRSPSRNGLRLRIYQFNGNIVVLPTFSLPSLNAILRVDKLAPTVNCPSTDGGTCFRTEGGTQFINNFAAQVRPWRHLSAHIWLQQCSMARPLLVHQTCRLSSSSAWCCHASVHRLRRYPRDRQLELHANLGCGCGLRNSAAQGRSMLSVKARPPDPHMCVQPRVCFAASLADDGSQLLIDEVALITMNVVQASTPTSASVTLSAGWHAIRRGMVASGSTAHARVLLGGFGR